MVQESFYNRGTETKLKTVFDYANFYTTVLSNKPVPQNPFTLHYLDVFAGTGEVPLANSMPLLEGVGSSDEIASGSAKMALEVTKPFSRYVFSDKKKANALDLEKLRLSFPQLQDRVKITSGDANDIVRDFCNSLGPNDRALVFLDPFGNQVKWETLELLAASKKVDLWYLFPAWIGVARQIKNTGEILVDAEPSIDAMFGPNDWRAKCLETFAPDQTELFGDTSEKSRKIATADGITRFMIDCMSSIFEGGVSQKWLPLGRDGRHYYSLLFACANPSAKAHKLAQRVAREIMTRGK